MRFWENFRLNPMKYGLVTLAWLGAMTLLQWVLKLPLRLIEDAFLGWVNQKIAEHVGSISTVLEIAISILIQWGIPAAMAYMIVYMAYKAGVISERKRITITSTSGRISANIREEASIIRRLTSPTYVYFSPRGMLIQDSFGISSVTDNGQGDYSINFLSPLNEKTLSVLPIRGTSGSFKVISTDFQSVRIQFEEEPELVGLKFVD